AVMLEKLIWNTAFGLLCERHDVEVGGVLDGHADELAALSRELAAVGRAALGVDLDDAALLTSLRAYASSIPGYRAGVKEWPWRGGWFDESARIYRVEVPTFDALVGAIPRLSR